MVGGMGGGQSRGECISTPLINNGANIDEGPGPLFPFGEDLIEIYIYKDWKVNWMKPH